MGSAASKNPLNHGLEKMSAQLAIQGNNKRDYLRETTGRQEHDDIDNEEDNKTKQLHRGNCDFSDRYDESLISSGRVKLLTEFNPSLAAERTNEVEVFFIDRAMKYLDVDGTNPKIKHIFKRILFPSMRLITFPPDTVVFEEGETGTNLYLVETGILEVSVDGNEFCLLGKGAMFGEMSLLFGLLRNCTVKTLDESCRIWSLDRKSYREIMIEIANPALSINSKRFLEVPEIATLPNDAVEKVMMQLTSLTFHEGIKLYSEGYGTTKIMVIESGTVDLFFPDNVIYSHMNGLTTRTEMLTKYGISVDITCPPPSTEGSQLVTLTNFAGNLGGGMGLSSLLQRSNAQGYLEQLAAQQVDRNEAISAAEMATKRMMDGKRLVDRSEQLPSEPLETKKGDEKQQEQGIIQESTDLTVVTNVKESVVGKVLGPGTESSSEDVTPELSPNPLHREGVLPSLTELMSSMGLKKLQMQLSNIKSGGGSEKVVNQPQRRSLDGSTLPMDKFHLLSISASGRMEKGLSSSRRSLAGLDTSANGRMEKGLSSSRRSLTGLDTSANGRMEKGLTRSLHGLDTFPTEKLQTQLISPHAGSGMEKGLSQRRSLNGLDTVSVVKGGSFEKVVTQRRSLGILSMVRHVQDSMKAADASVVDPMTERRLREPPLRKSLVVLPALSPNTQNAVQSEKLYRSTKGSITPPIASVSAKIVTGGAISKGPGTGLRRSFDNASTNSILSARLDAVSALLMSSNKEHEDESDDDLSSGMVKIKGKDKEKNREVSDGGTIRDSPGTLSGRLSVSLRSVSPFRSTSPPSSSKISTKIGGEFRPGTGASIGIDIGSRPGTSLDLNSSQRKPSSAAGAGMPNYLKPIGYVFKTLGKGRTGRALGPISDGVFIRGSTAEAGSEGSDKQPAHASDPHHGQGDRDSVDEMLSVSANVSRRSSHALLDLTGKAGPQKGTVEYVAPLLERKDEEEKRPGEWGQTFKEKCLRVGEGCIIGMHVLPSLLRNKGAPEWKDEIFNGTPSVGCVSGITAVVSSSTAQVTCLNTFGFQKAFGMSTFSHSFVDQKPLREIIDEWKREDKAAADLHKRSNSSRSSLMTLEKGKCDVFTEDSFGEMEVIKTTETGVIARALTSYHVVSFLDVHSTHRSPSFEMNSTDFAFFTAGGHTTSGKTFPGMTMKDKNQGKRHKQELVLKISHKSKALAHNGAKSVLSEASILASSAVQGCTFIVQLLGKFQTPDSLILVMESLPPRDLWGFIYTDDDTDVPKEKRFYQAGPYNSGNSNNKQLTLPLIRFYMASVATALSHLHKHCIVYRNLKPEHVFIDDKGHIKLIDFSCAKKLPYRDDHGRLQNKAFTICGVAEYLAPEMILIGGHNQSVDAWALGVFFHELLIGLTPFVPELTSQQSGSFRGTKTSKSPKRTTDVDAQILSSIADVQVKGLNLSRTVSLALMNIDGCLDLLLGLLTAVASSRTPLVVKTGSEICKCEFFKGFDWEELWAGTMIAPYRPRPIPLEMGFEYRCIKRDEQQRAENKESEAIVHDKLVANYLNSTVATRLSAAQAKVQRQVKTVREEGDGMEEDEDGFDVNMTPAEKARIINRGTIFETGTYDGTQSVFKDF